MSVRMRSTRAHTANRRGHHKLDSTRKSKCEKCGVLAVRHQACVNCGSYRGREVIDVTAEIKKKEEKMKKREAALKKAEKAESKSDKPLELAKK